jgi:heat-inducible transcriptional repressor
MMQLNDRENLILKTTIEDFISSGLPISSQKLYQYYFHSISPATIRNTLAALEKKGLLKHMHTSSGRLPTDSGYRYYVDTLIQDNTSMIDEYDNVSNSLSAVADNLEDLLQATALMLGKISHLFGVVMVSHQQRSILTDIELVQMASDRIMVVLALKSGFIRSVVLNLDLAIKDSDLEIINQALKDRLLGLSLDEIQDTILDRMRETDVYDHEIVQVLIQNSDKHFVISGDKLIYTSSFSQLLDYPEFHEIDKLQTLMALFNEESLEGYFDKYLIADSENILIGKEMGDSNFTGCSIVTNPFSNENIRGQMAILGPTRLPYEQIKTILTNFTEIIDNVS